MDTYNISVYTNLLYVPMIRYASVCVSLVLEPGDYSLQRPVGTAPFVVIKVILHVVMVAVVAINQ